MATMYLSSFTLVGGSMNPNIFHLASPRSLDQNDIESMAHNDEECAFMHASEGELEMGLNMVVQPLVGPNFFYLLHRDH